MIGFLALGSAIFYALSWVRITDIDGIALPISRLLGMLGVCYLPQVLRQSTLHAGAAKRFFLVIGCAVCYIIFSGLVLGLHDVEGRQLFSFSLFYIEISKIVSGVGTASIVYLYLRQHRGNFLKFIACLNLSMKLCLGFTALFLVLFLLKIPMDIDWLAPNKGGYVGIWDQGTTLPRLAGTTPEPQAFSYAFVTPVLIGLAIARKNIMDFLWPFIGVMFLLISFSKFSVISLAVILFFLLIRHRGFGWVMCLLALIAIIPMLEGIFSSYVFKEFLEDGIESGAFAERAVMNRILWSQFLAHPLFGIGLGQFSVQGRDDIIAWLISKGMLQTTEKIVSWKGNMDYLTLLAETGLLGAIPIISCVFFYTIQGLWWGKQIIRNNGSSLLLAVSLGTVVILCNMAIGYAFFHSLLWVNLAIICYLLDEQDG
ncbi:MAG: hypothetical protein ACOYK8_05055 [Alphaproteobacteria bacterium]